MAPNRKPQVNPFAANSAEGVMFVRQRMIYIGAQLAKITGVPFRFRAAASGLVPIH